MRAVLPELSASRTRVFHAGVSEFIDRRAELPPHDASGARNDSTNDV